MNNKISVVFNGLYYSFNQIGEVTDGVNFEGVINIIDGVTDGTKRELINILRLFSRDEGLTLKDIALKMGRPTKTIERYLKIMKDTSILEFRGAPRNGKYYLMSK